MAMTTLPDKPVMTVQRVVGLMTHRHSVGCCHMTSVTTLILLYALLQEGMIERHVKAMKTLANNNKQGFVSLTVFYKVTIIFFDHSNSY